MCLFSDNELVKFYQRTIYECCQIILPETFFNLNNKKICNTNLFISSFNIKIGENIKLALIYYKYEKFKKTG